MDPDKLIAEQMNIRRHHLRCAQEVEKIPIMAAAKKKHEAIARACSSQIRELCLKRRLEKPT
jgi:hypothetical protein